MKPLRDHAQILFKSHRTEVVILTAICLAVFVFSLVFWYRAYLEATHEIEISFDAHAAQSLSLETAGNQPEVIQDFPVRYPDAACDWDLSIEATGEKNPGAWGAQIWIQQIATENGIVPWDSVSADSGWTRVDSEIGTGGKALVSYDEGKRSQLRVRVRSNQLGITYTRHEWSGIMKVTANGKTRTIDAWRSSFAPDTLELFAKPAGKEVIRNACVSRVLCPGQMAGGIRVRAVGGSIELKYVTLDGHKIHWDEDGTLLLPSRFRLAVLPSIAVSLLSCLCVPLLGILLWEPCKRHPLTAFTLLVVMLKLWMISGDEMIASAYDARGYMLSSLHGFWGMPLDVHSYDRQPGYPLTIAAGRLLGLPLRVWLELLYCSACIVAASALPRLRLPRWSYAPALALMVFNPLTFPVMTFGYQDVAYAPFFIFFAGACLHMLPPGRGRLAAGIAAGIAGALVWNTRPEHLMVEFLILVMFLIIGAMEWAGGKKLRKALLHAVTAVMPVAVVILSVSVGICAKGRTSSMGAFAASNFQMPGFTALYDELLAIQPEHPEAYHPIPTEVRMKAYAASPSFARMKEALEGPALDAYRGMAEADGRVKNDFGVFIFWGLRLAPWRIRNWASANELDRFYARCADELKAARKSGAYKSREVPMHFVDPAAGLWLPNITKGAAIYWHTLSRSVVEGLYPEDPKVDGELFDRAALRRSALTKTNNAVWTNPSTPSIRLAKRICAIANSIATWAAAVLFIPFGVLLAWKALRTRNSETMLACALLLFLVAAFASRFAMLSTMHATAFAAETRYILPVAPLPALLLCALLAWSAGRLHGNRACSKPENPDA